MKPLTSVERSEIPNIIGDYLYSHGWDVRTDSYVRPADALRATLGLLSDPAEAAKPPSGLVFKWTAPDDTNQIEIDCDPRGPASCGGLTVTVYRHIPEMESEDGGQINHGVLGMVPHTDECKDALLDYITLVAHSALGKPRYCESASWRFNHDGSPKTALDFMREEMTRRTLDDRLN